ncbi:MAG TPA: GFA family protein [Novosphingobium sp.]
MKASCQCGQLHAEVPGPSPAVVACHCIACQKRSGSPFGEAAYYPHDRVKVEGRASHFTRPTDAGGVFDQFFCPDCGTTVYMRGTKNPDMIGIPIGLFDEPHAMQPVRSVWEQHRHDWVEIATAVQHYPQGRTG